jgi:4-diphosphocytidyl-2C-methyl-D-erythritol kinase
MLLPHDRRKASTADVYADFDGRDGAAGFEERRARLRETLAQAKRPRDLAELPSNDLAASPHAERVLELGAFRADVSGAGPAVYGLFLHHSQAAAAERDLRALGRTWITVPTWYG